jgi:hypothetical protein
MLTGTDKIKCMCHESENVFWLHYSIGLKPFLNLDWFMYSLRLSLLVIIEYSV